MTTERSRPVQILSIADPPLYYQTASTGTVHLVKEVTRVTWANGTSHTSVAFWCFNLGSGTKGSLTFEHPGQGRDCPGCIRSKSGRRGRGRRKQPQTKEA